MNNGHSRQFVIICPGIHDLQLTQDFLEALRSSEGNLLSSLINNILIFPTEDYPAYSAIHILEFLQRQIHEVKTPLVFISFSAGVVGAIGAAWSWELLGGKVKAFIAIDGWGVPLSGNFPIHRLSHDYFTYWSSALLGGGEDSFYADPAVEHLELWKSPDSCGGWWVQAAAGGKAEQRHYTTAAQFVNRLLQVYV